jgi:hypothetical protein
MEEVANEGGGGGAPPCRPLLCIAPAVELLRATPLLRIEGVADGYACGKRLGTTGEGAGTEGGEADADSGGGAMAGSGVGVGTEGDEADADSGGWRWTG